GHRPLEGHRVLEAHWTAEAHLDPGDQPRIAEEAGEGIGGPGQGAEAVEDDASQTDGGPHLGVDVDGIEVSGGGRVVRRAVAVALPHQPEGLADGDHPSAPAPSSRGSSTSVSASAACRRAKSSRTYAMRVSR